MIRALAAQARSFGQISSECKFLVSSYHWTLYLVGYSTVKHFPMQQLTSFVSGPLIAQTRWRGENPELPQWSPATSKTPSPSVEKLLLSKLLIFPSSFSKSLPPFLLSDTLPLLPSSLVDMLLAVSLPLAEVGLQILTLEELKLLQLQVSISSASSSSQFGLAPHCRRISVMAALSAWGRVTAACSGKRPPNWWKKRRHYYEGGKFKWRQKPQPFYFSVCMRWQSSSFSNPSMRPDIGWNSVGHLL